MYVYAHFFSQGLWDATAAGFLYDRRCQAYLGVVGEGVIAGVDGGLVGDGLAVGKGVAEGEGADVMNRTDDDDEDDDELLELDELEEEEKDDDELEEEEEELDDDDEYVLT